MVDGGTEGKTQENLNSQGNSFECEKLSFVIVNYCCSILAIGSNLLLINLSTLARVVVVLFC